MSDTEIYKALKKDRQVSGEKQRQLAEKDFKAARTLAATAGLELIKHTPVHYALKYNGWTINLYPGNQRIYRDQSSKNKAPFLNIEKSPWLLSDIVKAALTTLNKVSMPNIINKPMPISIQDRAYQLWEEAGRPNSDGVEFWLKAESECVKTP